jgi:3-methyladenine DNA glycosylase AlkD
MTPPGEHEAALLTSTADDFLQRLEDLRPNAAIGPAAEDEGANPYAEIRMGQIFALARDLQDMAPSEIERLLESPAHAVRVGAVSVMDWQARDKKTTDERRRELFELYIRRHDRIDTWDLVDRAAIWVVGEYLLDKPRDGLDHLSRSERPMERRTAVVCTYAFIRRGELDDTFRIAKRLVDDEDDLVQKAVGWMLREAGMRDPSRLTAFIDAHAATMPRVMLRYAIEKLDPARRKRYLGMRRG